ncbi:Putative beta-lactamase-inhibitor-like, PepSY-like [Pontibacter akesuensis]|uniref:Putative beta-lactamase-inhibitor-like, PepSY-like n=2 Tax=Pontibacter akesuensis TaxID=388950 RepID=A0A1I7HQQ8_9BACT|nr:hypothetical protein GCM10007389_14420 [Pontibacter akesuensis]SFU63052.1 Putative beta-lactamase-inhibitor-like, PepSY-like [Pontibacter akesuensis]
MLAILLASSTLFACDKEDQDLAPDKVPAEVKASLVKTFTNAINFEWEKKEANYEVDFDMNTVEYSALFTASGEMLMHKYDITATELPEEVKTVITQHYTDYRIDDAEVVDKAGTRYYQVDLKKDNMEKRVVLAADGQEQAQISYWD